MQATTETRNGVLVWESELDRLRRDGCMCLNCKKMKRCVTAQTLYSICKAHELAMIITRCPMWEVK